MNLLYAPYWVNKDKVTEWQVYSTNYPPGIAQQILNNYHDIKSAEDVQDVLKQILKPHFWSMLKGEMEKSSRPKKHERSRNSDNVPERLFIKTLKTSLGGFLSRVPSTVRLNRRSRSTSATFLPSIEGKVLAM